MRNTFRQRLLTPNSPTNSTTAFALSTSSIQGPKPNAQTMDIPSGSGGSRQRQFKQSEAPTEPEKTLSMSAPTTTPFASLYAATKALGKTSTTTSSSSNNSCNNSSGSSGNDLAGQERIRPHSTNSTAGSSQPTAVQTERMNSSGSSFPSAFSRSSMSPHQHPLFSSQRSQTTPSSQLSFSMQQASLPLLPATLSRHASCQSQLQTQSQARPLPLPLPISQPASNNSAGVLQRPRFFHQRTLSVQGIMTPHTLASTSSMDNTPLSDAAASTVRGKRQSRRNSFAASANLSIVHGLPIDPDRLEMDDDDDDDLGNSSGVDDDGNFDGDIDEDSLMLDDNADGSVGCPSSRGWHTSEYDAESLSQHTNYKNSSTFDWELDSARIRLMAEEFERDKNKIAAATSSQPADMPASSSLSIAKNDCHLQPPGSAPLGRRLSLNVPRNKAFVRLLSLVEEDVSPLASEMEHEGHITRNIRHSNVHEWLRSSHAHHSSNSNNSNSNSQQAIPLVLDDIHAPNAGSGSPLRKTARILPTRMVRENSADSGACSRDTIATPTSPASSVASSPSVLAGGAAAGSIAGMNINAGLSGQGSNRASASTGMSIITSVRSGKRKSVDDGYGSSYSCSRSPLELSPSACSPLRHPYKRQAMSPSGLRMQIAIGGKSKLISSPTLAPASSTSPQLQPQMARPVAFPIVSHNHQPLPSPSAGTCPSINNNPLFQGILYGSVGGGGSGSSGIISRARSRSGAAIGTVPGGGAVGGGLSILQANGGLSRMNLEDKMDDDDDDDDDNDDDDNDNDGV